MPRCIVNQCVSESGGMTGVKTHNVPSAKSDISQRKVWLANCGRMDLLFKTVTATVCSLHFARSCFTKNMRVERMEGRIQYDLLRGSTPTIFKTRHALQDENYPPSGLPPPTGNVLLSRLQTENVNPRPSNVLTERFSGNQECWQDGEFPRSFGPSPTKKMKRMKKVFRDFGTQTEKPNTASIEIQTENRELSSVTSHLLLSDHTYTQRLTSTPAKNLHSETLVCDISCITAFQPIVELPEKDTCDMINGPENNSSSSGDSQLSVCYLDNENHDPTFHPNESDISTESSGELDTTEMSNKTFIVYGCSLQSLLKYVSCEVCEGKAMMTNTFTRGTLLAVDFQCENGHDFTWKSQPEARKMPVGNLMMAAAVLFSGASFSSLKMVSSLLNLNFIHRTTQNRIQETLLYGVIQKAWKEHQQDVITKLEGRPLRLAGDGRCDSPGFSAKYGTYTLMDMDTKLIVDFYVAQCTETGNSVGMEKHGLKKCLENLDCTDLDIETVATDRHVQIRKFLKEERPGINHQFDVWHMGKTISKKVRQKAKQKGCEDLGPWSRSVVNHLWYACATCNEDADVLLEKWTSILFHITNQHVFPGNFVTACGHGPLENIDLRKTKWLKPNTKPYDALSAIVFDVRLRKDIRQLSRFCHTGHLESYHSLLLKYCPKRLHFSMQGMNARTQLAVMDHNNNVNREQAKIKKGCKKGTLRFKTEFPKMSKQWIAKKIYEEKSYDHVHDLVKLAVACQDDNVIPERPQRRCLPRNIACADKPCKDDLVTMRISRFGDEHEK